MKRRLIVFLQIALLLLMCVPAVAAADGADITLDLSENAAAVGERVTASGETAPDAWVPLKVVDDDQNIVVFDAQRADADGNYSIGFKVPAGASGTLTVVVGEGSNVATGTLTVGTETPDDTQAPTWPNGSTVSASNVTRTGLTLAWSAAADNVGVTKYKIYKGGDVIATVSATSRAYNVTGLSADTSYTFKVEAGDAAGNWSTSGPSTTVTTKKVGGGSSGSSSSSGNVTPTSPETSVSKPITAATGGTVNCEQLSLEIPAGALPGDATVSVSVLTSGEANEVVPQGMRVKLGSDVYEISTTGSREFGDRTITIKVAYDPSKIAADEQPVLNYYDETAGKWVALETTVVQENGNWYAVTSVNHLTKFAVFSADVDEVKVVKLAIGQLAVSINGSPYTLDAAPYADTQAGRTLVPVRFVSEALGAKVDWRPESGQVIVTDGGKEIVLTLGARNVLVNGQTTAIDCTPAVLPPGRVFVPLRFVSETLGAQVDFELQTMGITVTR